MKTVLLTALAMIAFASNSILCRLALGPRAIDPGSFTTVRILSGAATLAVVATVARRGRPGRPGSWGSAFALFLYAIAFSLAYVRLSTGTGALILFAMVQATMIAVGLRSGERPHALEWAGLVVALGGLVALVLPGLTSPSPSGSALMALAGISWGFYSLRGRGAPDPIAVTADNFARAIPLAIGVSLVMLGNSHLTARGILLAALSGAIASGIGYAIWYAALRGLTATRAATVQLVVPVIAATGGVLFLSESVSLRLVGSAIAILGGIAIALLGSSRSHQPYLPGR